MNYIPSKEECQWNRYKTRISRVVHQFLLKQIMFLMKYYPEKGFDDPYIQIKHEYEQFGKNSPQSNTVFGLVHTEYIRFSKNRTDVPDRLDVTFKSDENWNLLVDVDSTISDRTQVFITGKFITDTKNIFKEIQKVVSRLQNEI